MIQRLLRVKMIERDFKKENSKIYNANIIGKVELGKNNFTKKCKRTHQVY